MKRKWRILIFCIGFVVALSFVVNTSLSLSNEDIRTIFRLIAGGFIGWACAVIWEGWVNG